MALAIVSKTTGRFTAPRLAVSNDHHHLAVMYIGRSVALSLAAISHALVNNHGTI